MVRVSITKLARERAGYRERYAMDHCTSKATRLVNGHKLWEFRYDEDDPYQDANGATYDCTEGRWIS